MCPFQCDSVTFRHCCCLHPRCHFCWVPVSKNSLLWQFCDLNLLDQKSRWLPPYMAFSFLFIPAEFTERASRPPPPPGKKTGGGKKGKVLGAGRERHEAAITTLTAHT